MNPLIVEYLIPIIGGGGLGAAITYILTLKSKTKIVKAEAEMAQVKAAHEKLDYSQDSYNFLQEKCDKYLRDYYQLEQTLRDKVKVLREEIDRLMAENSITISDKCNEIASLKSQLTYLKGIRCYNHTCPNRVKNNPDKIEQ